nr:putative integron gene cassette protein [uncultured bacterium]
MVRLGSCLHYSGWIKPYCFSNTTISANRIFLRSSSSAKSAKICPHMGLGGRLSKVSNPAMISSSKTTSFFFLATNACSTSISRSAKSAFGGSLQDTNAIKKNSM